jgi:hypothetical protein
LVAVNPGSAYLDHLTDADLSILGGAVDAPRADDASAYLRSHPELVEDALGSPTAFERVLGDPVDDELLLHASPFLVFAVAVHRVVDDLGHTRFVEERVGRRMRVPVFDAGQLREFGLGSPRQPMATAALQRARRGAPRGRARRGAGGRPPGDLPAAR